MIRFLSFHGRRFLDEEAFAYTSLLPAAVVLLLAVFYAGRTFLVARYMDNMQAADKRAREKTKRKRILQLALYARVSRRIELLDGRNSLRLHFLQIAGVLIAVVISAGLTKFLGGDASWILYHIGQGLQGLLVALSVTCDCQILKLYTKSLRCGGGGGGGGGSFPAAPKNLTFDARHILGRDSALSPANSLKLLTLEIADPVWDVQDGSAGKFQLWFHLWLNKDPSYQMGCRLLFLGGFRAERETKKV